MSRHLDINLVAKRPNGLYDGINISTYDYAGDYARTVLEPFLDEGFCARESDYQNTDIIIRLHEFDPDMESVRISGIPAEDSLYKLRSYRNLRSNGNDPVLTFIISEDDNDEGLIFFTDPDNNIVIGESFSNESASRILETINAIDWRSEDDYDTEMTMGDNFASSYGF